MVNFQDAIQVLLAKGYNEDNVEEKLAQDIILQALYGCGFREHVAVKGGVVMANLTQDIRRTTMDVDIDFIRFSLEDENVKVLVEHMNCVEGVSISLVGDIIELRQHDYRGKRVFLSIQDSFGNTIEGKIDIGVHTMTEAVQEELPFEVGAVNPEVVVLFANTPEQVFVEKLKSLLRLGPISNRAKDVDDMLYLSGRVSREKLLILVKAYIYDDDQMLERDMAGVIRRMRRTFSDAKYIARLSHRRANWLQIPPAESTQRLLSFMQSLA